MICSVLTPSRRNPIGLIATVLHIASTTDPNKVEHLLRLDDDDAQSIAIIPGLRQFPNVRVVTGPRLGGYSSMGHYLAELSSVARGKWITMLDDDCTLEKKYPEAVNWETQLESIPDWGTYVAPEFYHLGASQYPSGSCSPVGWFAPRNFWEKFGFLECGIPCDAWTHELLKTQEKWPTTLLRGIIYNHQKELGRSRE